MDLLSEGGFLGIFVKAGEGVLEGIRLGHKSRRGSAVLSLKRLLCWRNGS